MSAWNLALYRYLNDEKYKSSILYEDMELMIIEDKYPKAKHHYLVLTKRKELTGPEELNPQHIEHLNHMTEIIQEKLVNKFPSVLFQIGIHAIPSMKPLHVHVVSQDFDSIALKRKSHWNSFTTSFFVTLSDVVSNLVNNLGALSEPQEFYEQLRKQALQCHLCNFEFRNLPSLKKHYEGCFKESVNQKHLAVERTVESK